MKKKSFYCLWLVALCSFVLPFFAACSDNSSNNRIEATISNKPALTAEWTAEDADRSVELTFNPSSYNADNAETVVSSSNSNVVLASGTKLSAIGPGTATISVAVEGTVTDSVEVSVKAKQTGIVISNAQEISSDWVWGESERVRTLEVAKVYKNAKSVPLTGAQVNVTSSAPDVVSVSGLTLTAEKIGKSTITVTAGDFEASVELAVKPPLEEFSIDNQSNLAEVLCGWIYEMQPSFTPSEYYTKENTTPTVEFGTEGILRYEGGYKFKTLNVGSTSVRVTIAGKTVEFNVIVLDSTFAINPTDSNGAKMFFERVDKNGNVSVIPAKSGYMEREATFNVEASTQYYAEATFTYNVTSDWPTIGLAHFNALNKTIGDGDAYNNAGNLFGRRCIESVMTSSGKFIIKDLKQTDDHWYQNYANNNIYLNSSFKANATFTTMTIAIARNGNTIYTFVDGRLVDASDIAWDYWDAKLLTTPGIITCGNAGSFTVSGINVLSGAAAQTKLNEVTAQKSIFGNNPTFTTTGGYAAKAYREYLGEDGDLKITSDRSGELAATFNMEAGTLYYAEATFNITNTNNYPAFGLAHFTALNTSVNKAADPYDAGSSLGRACIASIKSGSSATFFIGNLTASIERWHFAANTAAELYKNANFKANNFTQMTIAIARTADKLYTFVDGVLVTVINAPEGYKDVATTPGIITICSAKLFKASNITVLSGTEAQAKINALTGTNA